MNLKGFGLVLAYLLCAAIAQDPGEPGSGDSGREPPPPPKEGDREPPPPPPPPPREGGREPPPPPREGGSGSPPPPHRDGDHEPPPRRRGGHGRGGRGGPVNRGGCRGHPPPPPPPSTDGDRRPPPPPPPRDGDGRPPPPHDDRGPPPPPRQRRVRRDGGPPPPNKPPISCFKSCEEYKCAVQKQIDKNEKNGKCKGSPEECKLKAADDTTVDPSDQCKSDISRFYKLNVNAKDTRCNTTTSAAA